MTEFKIDKNVPLPDDGKSVSSFLATLRQMEPADSVFYPNDKDQGRSVHASIAYLRKSNPDKKYVTRKVEGGRRIWRVA